MADVNGDNLLDIYGCYSGNMPTEARINELFINQGPDASGNPRFQEQVSELKSACMFPESNNIWSKCLPGAFNLAYHLWTNCWIK